MHWEDICAHPSLQDLPFKIETNANGQIVMNAVKVAHALYQGEIEHLLRLLLPTGKTLPECAIKTAQGIRVADVAWVSQSRLMTIRHEAACSIAPEICIEVYSDSNTDDEMQEKRALYFACGAHEVWVCRDGVMSFYHAQGQLDYSLLAPQFPVQVMI
ncbi:Uma2 family endonuclease [Thiospirillum jenense]|uniref:Uma2 family endonuclease n=1 Tax=Thiospirillum jenense TaxID=1653858 RepID=A0A839HD00_9GAMM|nr:Uma2 family endonuclease [Thiospirillum jenense]MBB1125067.1 Uma2 family endonuclease [Thiospirillum jenense]